MHMMEQQVMNILTTGYAFSGMERNERNPQEKNKHIWIGEERFWMNPKMIVKTGVDIGMTVALMF